MLDATTWGTIENAASQCATAKELTHPIYRYPARLSPYLARAIIHATTKPGDLIMDPFCGGGTTAIEAIVSGRHIVASDMNPLACFVTLAKAYPIFEEEDKQAFLQWIREEEESWSSDIPFDEQMQSIVQNSSLLDLEIVQRLFHLREKIGNLKNPSAKRLALLTVLRLGQIYFDSSNQTNNNLQASFRRLANYILSKVAQYARISAEASQSEPMQSALRVLEVDASRLGFVHIGDRTPRLVLTSPPYPNVHVLYNKWQIKGRGETNLPYALLGIKDGSPPSFYTFAPRQRSRSDELYFKKLQEIWMNLRYLLGPQTIVAQIVSFPNPIEQLPKFRKTMNLAGFKEIQTAQKKALPLITRQVPNRQWYTRISKSPTQAFEYMFFHRIDSNNAKSL